MNTIIIRIPEASYDLDKDIAMQWCIIGKNENTEQIEITGNIADFANYYKSLLPNNSSNRAVILALPSTMVFYKNIKINQKHKKYLSSTLPYCIEEYLSVNIEEMHIQYSKLNSNLGYINVCAIGNDLIEKTIELFNEYSIPLDSIIAESQLYHTEENSISLVLDRSSLILVNRDDQGIVIDNEKLINHFESIKTIGSDLKDENISTNNITKINFLYTSKTKKENIDFITNLINDSKLSVDISKLENTIIDYISRNYKKIIKNNEIVDLRQGAYACRKKIGRMINKWKPIAIALCCFLVIDILISTGLGLVYSEKKSDVWQINMAKYIELFPKDQQAIRALQKHDYKFDVQKMLKNRLKSFDQSTTDDTFLSVWYQLSMAIEESKLQSLLEKIDYTSSSKKIKLEFSAGDIQEINKLKSIISRYDLDVQEYTQDKTKYLLIGKKA